MRAAPCLWIGSERYQSTVLFGFYKSFDIAFTYFDYSDSDCDPELEGPT